jgi:hypothetical protein
VWTASIRSSVPLHGNALRRFLVTVVLTSVLMAASFPVRATKPSNPYPNELPGFKFYAKYLYPLRPLHSVSAQVVTVLGSDGIVEAGRWWILPSFVVEFGSQVAVNRLHSVTITPRERVSMREVKFPAAFTHVMGGVSEAHACSCDVYVDRFGLQYWLYQEDYNTDKKGDLFQIVYGPPH